MIKIGYNYNMYLINPYIYGGAPSFTNTYSLTSDGVDESVNVGRVTATESTANISFSFWFKVPSLAANRQIFGRYNSTGPKELRCTTKTGGEFAFWITGVECRTPASTISANTWHHAAVTYDGTGATNADKVKIYIDGSSKSLTFSGTVPTTTDNGTDVFRLLAITIASGLVTEDECRIYDYTLSSVNVSDIYNSGSPKDDDLATKAIHWWRMGDGATWDGSNWTIPDVGTLASNNGTSANMEEADRTTDTP